MRSKVTQPMPRLSLRRLARQRKRSMGGAEISLKLLIGIMMGAELIGGPVLLLLGVFWDFNLIRWPLFSATWMLASAILGAILSLRFLPRFSRDRGRIADFLIDPRHVGSSLGFLDRDGR